MIGAIAAGAMAVGSLVQLYNSEMARGAEKKRLREIEELYNSIKPPDYDLNIQDPPRLHEEKLALPEFSGPLAAPKFNLNKLTPEKFKQVGQFIPEVAPYIAEEQPKLIEQTEGMKTGREAQMNALRRLQQIGSDTSDPEYQEAVTRASRQAQADAQSRQASLLQDFARRGQSGSGLQLAAQIGANAQAMDREAMTNLSAATNAYRNRLEALAQGAELGGRISSEDQSLQSRNADIINAFNSRMAAGRQNFENQRAGLLNDAQQYNLGLGQNLSNMNVQAANAANQSQQQRLDDISRFNYQTQASQQGRSDDIAKWQYGQGVDQQRYSNDLALKKYGIQQANQDKLNQLKGQQYQDAINRAGLKSGIAGQQIAANRAAAQDRNSALQGILNVGNIYAQNREAQQNVESQNELKQQMASKSAFNDANNSFFKTKGRWMEEDEADDWRDRYNG